MGAGSGIGESTRGFLGIAVSGRSIRYQGSEGIGGDLVWARSGGEFTAESTACQREQREIVTAARMGSRRYVFCGRISEGPGAPAEDGALSSMEVSHDPTNQRQKPAFALQSQRHIRKGRADKTAAPQDPWAKNPEQKARGPILC
jgi:hypothetical protein